MENPSLADLGWSARLAASAAGAEGAPARISAVARDRLEALTPDGAVTLTLPGGSNTGEFAVGDWVLHDPGSGRVLGLVARATLLSRRAAGTGVARQFIAANVDTLGIVSACNADFNPARLERYLALAAGAGCLPLVILTRADEAEDPASFRRRAEALSPLVAAVTLDARRAEEVAALTPWCDRGQTLALVGSSGVGKTTLSNALTGRGDATGGIRADDAKGRHTTTARALRRTLAGGWLVDTPGMRELQLADAEEGLDAVFADIAALEAECRFSDCSHQGEPGCAIAAAVASGALDQDRVMRREKLRREEARNSETISQSRDRARAREKLYRQGKVRGRDKRSV